MAACVTMWDTLTKEPPMSLFTPDLYRNFGIGFGLGAVAVLLSNGSDFLSAVPQLVASIL